MTDTDRHEQGLASSVADEVLIRRYRAGEVAAFETLVRRYEQELYPFLARFVRDRTAAEDVFQETFVQVHHSLDAFDVERRFRPWLFTIAANKARDYLRKAKKHAALELSAPIGGTGGGAGDKGGGRGGGYIDLLEADLPGPDEILADSEIADRVREVVSSLPDHLREILVMAYFHQFPYKQISEMLEIPLGTVKSRLHAAVGTFAEIWRTRYSAAVEEGVGHAGVSDRREGGGRGSGGGMDGG